MSLLISIHSSREGRYIVSYGYISFLSISIHTSREGRYSEKSYIVIWRYISIHSSHEGRYSNTAQKSDVIFLQYYQKLICFPYLLPQKLSKFPELAEKATCIPVRIPHTFYVSFWFAPEFRIIRSFESSQHLPESDPHESQKRNPGIF